VLGLAMGPAGLQAGGRSIASIGVFCPHFPSLRGFWDFWQWRSMHKTRHREERSDEAIHREAEN
jgi:hypothetical protein